MTEQTINLADWYTPEEGAKRLTANSGREIDAGYLRTLARYGRVRVLKLNNQMALYCKEDVDPYVVEDRGAKAARVMRQRALTH